LLLFFLQIGSDEFLGQVKLKGDQLLELPKGEEVVYTLETSDGAAGGGGKDANKFVQGSISLRFRCTLARDPAIANRNAAENEWLVWVTG
jgi:hypothetical protein